MNVFERILHIWIKTVCRFAWVVIVALLAVTYVLFDYTMDNVSINTNTTDMLSDELPFRQNYITYKSAFPKTGSLMTVVIEAETPERADASAEILAAALREETQTIETVYDFVGDQFFRRNGLLYLEVEELENLADRLSQSQGLLSALSRDTSLRGLSEVLGLAIDSATEGDAPISDLSLVFDRISDVISERTRGGSAELSWRSLMGGKDPDPADLRRFLQVRVNADWSSISPAAPAMDFIREKAKDLGFTSKNNISVRLAGGLALSTEELNSVFEGAKTASLLSLSMVSLCLLFGLRSLALVSATIVTLICGLIWTAAFAIVAVGHLNLLSVAFAVLFIGLGVDFGIHFVLRYAEEIGRGKTRSSALYAAATGVGGAMSLCAVSAAIGFYAFLPTAYLGLAELGLISGTGMFIALFMSLTLLPATLSLLPYKGVMVSEPEGVFCKKEILRRRGGIITACITIMASASLFVVSNLKFDFDPLNLHDPNAESYQTTIDLIRDSDTSPKTISAIRPNLEAARELAEKLAVLPEVAKVETVASFVPNAQEEKLAIIGDLAFVMYPVFQPNGLRKVPTASVERKALEKLLLRLSRTSEGADQRLAKASERLRKEILSFLSTAKSEHEIISLRNGLLGHFPRLIAQLKMAFEAGDVLVDDIPQALRERFLAVDGTARVKATPAFSVERNEDLRRFIEAVQAVAPNATDSPIVILEASRAVIDAILQAAITAGILIIILLFALLRSIRDTLLVFYPLVVAGLFTIGAVGVTGLPFNFANVIVLPLLMGLGVASGIHLVMRSRMLNDSASLRSTSTPRAVTFSALTTILSFGSLAISAHRGTASMGLLLTIAIGFTLFGGLVALPALMAWLESRRLDRRSTR